MTLRTLTIIVALALCCTLLGFIADLSERVPDVLTNLVDIGLMTVVLTILFTCLYWLCKGVGVLVRLTTS